MEDGDDVAGLGLLSISYVHQMVYVVLTQLLNILAVLAGHRWLVVW